MPPGSRTGAGGSQGQMVSSGWDRKHRRGLLRLMASIAITLVGHILLIFAAIPPVLDNPNGALGCFIITIIIMGAGTGGFKLNISPLIAEQQTGELHVRTEPSGERVLVDLALTIQRIYLVAYGDKDDERERIEIAKNVVRKSVGIKGSSLGCQEEKDHWYNIAVSLSLKTVDDFENIRNAVRNMRRVLAVDPTRRVYWKS
ncbi:oligopeptide transporter [Pyrrhoderma noxium]|uniref:Oligopeptide transporter n=1 Tax=Pyrrhoderma noxium TaxID=2282107 RepID=A0A286UCD3_9AGAM|nr:oligopeptide transporter [Pyrrhoderma noxium]